MKTELPHSAYLRATKLCDLNHPAVRDSARTITGAADTPKDRALCVFYFVRDTIPFDATLDIWEKASETLGKRVSDYCNKVNLQVALLRAAGIPARCHLVQVRKEVLRAFIPTFIYNRLPSPVGHFWCECHLDGRWIACETLFDEPLYLGMLSARLVTREEIPTINWDGESDRILFQPWIVSDVGTYPAFDDILASPMMSEAGMPPKILCKLLDPIPMFLSRRRTDSLRERRASGRSHQVRPQRQIAKTGVIGQTPRRYRHRFTALTDLLVSPYNLGFCVYNWGFTVLGGHRHDAFRRHVIDLAQLRGDEEILDAGCGTGLTTLRIVEQYPKCNVYGIDISSKMIDAARSDAAERGLEIDLRTGSITDLPYRDASFDVVLTNIMFHHLDLVEKRQAVAEIARVLRPGGRYVSAEFGPRARNRVERHLAKGEYTLYPSHLVSEGLRIRYEELSPFVWGLQVIFRVAVKPGGAYPESSKEE